MATLRTGAETLRQITADAIVANFIGGQWYLLGVDVDDVATHIRLGNNHGVSGLDGSLADTVEITVVSHPSKPAPNS